jgi:hypothetical protein
LLRKNWLLPPKRPPAWRATRWETRTLAPAGRCARFTERRLLPWPVQRTERFQRRGSGSTERNHRC